MITARAAITSEAATRSGLLGFQSVLWADPPALDELAEPSHFGDLHLDQIIAAATSGRDEYQLDVFYRRPLQTADEVAYRQAVVTDLLNDPVRDPIVRFAEQMRTMRSHLTLVSKLRHQLQRQRWFLSAVRIYCDATTELEAALDEAPCRSEGLRGLCSHLTALVCSEEFQLLAGDAADIHGELAALRYTITIKGAKVTVDGYEEQANLSVAVEDTFARFKQNAVKDYRKRFSQHADLNHVEEQVLDRIARLFPRSFARLAEFTSDHANDFNETVLRFDREVQFYLGFLAATDPVRQLGGGLTLPTVTDAIGDIRADAVYDLALAIKRAGDKQLPVANDMRLDRPERVLVITGPNQGGKTTFARSLGQMHYLASLGLPVAAQQAELTLPDAIFSHFEREETLDTLRSKFEDELVRLRDILDAATDHSLLIMNESFGSTTVADGLIVATEILKRVIRTGSIAVFVTFIDELAAIGPETVSMMSTVVPDDPAQRTFKIERKPADGLAYAAALAAKYRLRFDDVTERLQS